MAGERGYIGPIGPTGCTGATGATGEYPKQSYGYFYNCKAELKITDEMLVSFDVNFDSNDCPCRINGCNIIFNISGYFKLYYGIVCSFCENGSIEILLNNVPVFGSRINYLTSTGTTNSFTFIKAEKNDRLALKLKGGNIVLAGEGLNAFLLVEKVE